MPRAHFGKDASLWEIIIRRRFPPELLDRSCLPLGTLSACSGPPGHHRGGRGIPVRSAPSAGGSIDRDIPDGKKCRGCPRFLSLPGLMLTTGIHKARRFLPGSWPKPLSGRAWLPMPRSHSSGRPSLKGASGSTDRGLSIHLSGCRHNCTESVPGGHGGRPGRLPNRAFFDDPVNALIGVDGTAEHGTIHGFRRLPSDRPRLDLALSVAIRPLYSGKP